MGIDISGGMIVGANCSAADAGVYDEANEGYLVEGEYYEEFYEWWEYNGMSTYSFHYDACQDSQILGFTVEDIDPLSDDFYEWVEDVKEKAARFKELTGIDAKLIGMQNVW
tara:strand:- start:1069 stop:1401 length:333 start_codon:yes stop_codon:yes gene_type:complete